MYILDEEKAINILVDELGYKPHEATLFLKDFPPLHNQLGIVVEQWLKDRSVADVDVEGLKINEVMDNQQTNFLVTIRDLNDLLDESTPLVKRIEKRNFLSKPIFFE